MERIKNWFKKIFNKNSDNTKNIGDDIPDIDCGGVLKIKF